MREEDTRDELDADVRQARRRDCDELRHAAADPRGRAPEQNGSLLHNLDSCGAGRTSARTECGLTPLGCRERGKNSNIAVVLPANGSRFVAGRRPPGREFFSRKIRVNGPNPVRSPCPGRGAARSAAPQSRDPLILAPSIASSSRGDCACGPRTSSAPRRKGRRHNASKTRVNALEARHPGNAANAAAYPG